MAAPPSTSTIVPEVLGENNYEKWRILMRHYLEAQDLWDVVEGSNKPHGGNWREWRKRNASALHAIKFSCGAEMFNRIKEENSAEQAWNALADMQKLHEVTPGDIVEAPEESSQTGSVLEDSEPSLTGQRNLGRKQIVALLNAIYEGNISEVGRIFLENPNARYATLLENGHNALLVAITAGKEELAVKLIDLSTLEVLRMPDNLGNTALSLAARNGMIRTAKKLSEMFNHLLYIPDKDGKIPVVLAGGSGNKEMTSYLYEKTESDLLNPEKGNYHGLNLLQECIANKMFDIALDLLNKFPKLIRYRCYMASPLLTFARSGSPVVRRYYVNLLRRIIPLCSRSQGQYNSLAAKKVLRFILQELLELDGNQLVEIGAAKAAFEAIKHGNLNFVISITKANPDILWIIDPDDSTDMLAYAIAHRQEEIARFLYGFGAWKDINARNMITDGEGNNMLHLAAKLAPDFQLSRISGAALQLQNELRWFKAVESIVPRFYREHKNKNGYTPSEVFPSEHIYLKKEAEEWMKETAKSSTVVGAFIVTIMFAAAFTIPGGNDQGSGLPIFLSKSKENKMNFMIFVVSDAISLLTSASAVLMFLGILTSRYDYQDFLKSLPRKLALGISSLIISIAATMITFCAALLAMLQHRWWVFIPISLLAGIPVIFFWMSQSRLLAEIYTLTFSPDIFKSERS